MTTIAVGDINCTFGASKLLFDNKTAQLASVGATLDPTSLQRLKVLCFADATAIAQAIEDAGGLGGGSGPSSGPYVTHTQSSPSSVWTVTHNLGVYPLVYVLSPTQEVVECQVSHTSINQTVLTFSTPYAGTARFVGSYAVFVYEHTQATPASVWTVNHNLGYYPVVSVVDNLGEEIGVSIVHTSINQTVITSATPVMGVARFV